MSFDKNYPNRKDKRKPYRKSKAFDRSCRSHGNCLWCVGNRTYFDKKARLKVEKEIEEEYYQPGKEYFEI